MFTRYIRAAAVTLGLVVLLAATTGCVTPDRISQVQKSLADVQQDLRRIEQEQQETLEKLEALEAKADEGESISRAEFAELQHRLDSNTREVAVLREQVQDTNQRLDRVSHDIQETREIAHRTADFQVAAAGAAGVMAGAATGEGTPPDGAETAPAASAGGTGAVPDPEALYNAAYADFSKGNYALAISGFEEYAERFPASDLADNALYWVGECHFSQGSFDQAVEAFDRMLEAYPESDRGASANLKKGLAFLEQNQVGKAIVQLRYVHNSYPSSDEARIARDKLVSLGASVQ